MVQLALGPESAPSLFAATLMLILAVALLVLDRQRVAHRAFAALLAFRALSIVVGVLRGASGDPADVAYFQRLAPYFIIPVVPAAIYFASVYPQPRGWLGRSPHGGKVVLGVVLLAELAYLASHDLFWSFGPGAGSSFATAGRGLVYTDFGPLVFFLSLQFPVFGLVAFLTAQSYARAPSGSARFSEFLVFAGFALNALFDGTLQLAAVVRFLGSGEAYPWLPWGWAQVVLPSTTLVAALAAIAVLARHALRSPDARARAHARRFLLVAPLPVLTALGLSISGPQSAFLIGPGPAFVVGIWRLSLPLLVSYALVRHQLFEIDLTVKSTIRRGTVTVMLALVFFAVGEAAEAFVETSAGPVGALAAAGLFTMAAKPMERLGDRVADRVMPGVKPIEMLSAEERRAMFREQLALAQLDGTLSAKEKEMLEALQARLGIEEPGRRAAPRGLARGSR